MAKHQAETKSFNVKKIAAGVIGALLILAALIFISIHLLSSVKIKKALDDKSETYNRVQITASQKLTDLNKSQAAGDSSNESYVYYDEDGNEVSEEEVEKKSAETQNELFTLKKDGNTYFEDGIYGKHYFYKRNNEEYVLTYDDAFGLTTENGAWKEQKSENTETKPSFDFSILEKIKNSKLTKKKDYYIPKDSSVFYDIIKASNKDNYSDIQVKIYIDSGKLTKITLSCMYWLDASKKGTLSDRFISEQTYVFSYDDEKISIPKSNAELQK